MTTIWERYDSSQFTEEEIEAQKIKKKNLTEITELVNTGTEVQFQTV